MREKRERREIKRSDIKGTKRKENDDEEKEEEAAKQSESQEENVHKACRSFMLL